MKHIYSAISTHKLFLALLTITLACIAGISVGLIKGEKGDAFYYQTHLDIQTGGPFEQSISAARYALTASIVNNGSLFLTTDLAQFSSPDIVLYKGKFISVFTPGISFLGVPFYFLGKLFNIPQFATYLSTLLIGIVNIFLVMAIAKKLGAGMYTSLFAGLVFFFGTNELAYSFTFTQHTTSTMFILLGLLNAFKKRTFVSNAIFGVFFGLSLFLDVPNLFLMTPIALFILFKNGREKVLRNKIQLSVEKGIVGLFVGCIPCVILFGVYNYQTTGQFTKIAQFIGNTKYFNKPVQAVPTILAAPPEFQVIGMSLPFKTRYQLNGVYTLLISNERAWIYYCPVVFVGLLGIFISLKRKEKDITKVAVAIILVDIVMYSMFGDPWGGWNFGPRYLIPSAALLCCYIGLAIEKYQRNIVFIGLLLLLTIYSVWVNLMGALTTISIPPKVEAIALQNPIPYTYAYNQQLIAKNFSGSLFYNTYLFSHISEEEYLFILLGLITLLLVSVYVIGVVRKEKQS